MDLEQCYEGLWQEIGELRHPLTPDWRHSELERMTVHYRNGSVHSIELWLNDGLGLMFDEVSRDSNSWLQLLLDGPLDGVQLFFVSDIADRQWERGKVSVHFSDGDDVLEHLFYARSVRRLPVLSDSTS